MRWHHKKCRGCFPKHLPPKNLRWSGQPYTREVPDLNCILVKVYRRFQFAITWTTWIRAFQPEDVYFTTKMSSPRPDLSRSIDQVLSAITTNCPQQCRKKARPKVPLTLIQRFPASLFSAGSTVKTSPVKLICARWMQIWHCVAQFLQPQVFLAQR